MRTFSLSIWDTGTDVSANKCSAMDDLRWAPSQGLPHVEGPEDLCHLKATQLKD